MSDMKRLFDEKDNWTDDGRRIGQEFYNVVKLILVREHGECGDGFSTRDLEIIMLHEITMVCAEIKVRADIARRKAGL